MEPVTVVVPVLRRPHRAEPFMASLRESVGSDEPPPVIAVANVDDGETAEAWRRAGADVVVTHVEPGSYGQKANIAARIVDTDWMFLVGDDVCFHPGWLENALADLPDTACVVGTNDLGTQMVREGSHATHFLLRMDYIRDQGASWDGPGTVIGPYRHWFSDNELVTIAKMRGAWEMRIDSVVEHLHPLFDKGVTDETYEIGYAHAAADQLLWNQRLDKFAPELLRPVVDLTGG